MSNHLEHRLYERYGFVNRKEVPIVRHLFNAFRENAEFVEQEIKTGRCLFVLYLFGTKVFAVGEQDKSKIYTVLDPRAGVFSGVRWRNSKLIFD